MYHDTCKECFFPCSTCCSNYHDSLSSSLFPRLLLSLGPLSSGDLQPLTSSATICYLALPGPKEELPTLPPYVASGGCFEPGATAEDHQTSCIKLQRRLLEKQARGRIGSSKGSYQARGRTLGSYQGVVSSKGSYRIKQEAIASKKRRKDGSYQGVVSSASTEGSYRRITSKKGSYQQAGGRIKQEGSQGVVSSNGSF